MADLPDKSLTESLEKTSRLQRLADWLDNWHLTRIFSALGSFFLVLTLIGFTLEYSALQEERQAREEGSTVAAWQLLSIKASGNSGKIQALQYLNLKGEALTGIDLSPPNEQPPGAYLRQIQLANANLAYAKLNYADFSSIYNEHLKVIAPATNLTGITLSHASLIGAELKDVLLNRAVLKQANLSKAQLFGAQLNHANFYEANLSESYTSFAELNNVSLRRANLTDAAIVFSELVGADLSHANLTNADLASSNLKNALLLNADLRNTDLSSVKNLTCEQLTEASNWEKSIRDEALTCGSSFPLPQKDLLEGINDIEAINDTIKILEDADADKRLKEIRKNNNEG